jgi:hypothetical protein
MIELKQNRRNCSVYLQALRSKQVNLDASAFPERKREMNREIEEKRERTLR